MADNISTDTIYEGSAICRMCGALMTPLEVSYMDGNICPACHNRRAAAIVQGGNVG